jgi:pyrroline-5-carboxylate reductase
MQEHDAAHDLLLVGCGKMGGALLRGIVAARLASTIVVVEPSAPPADVQALKSVVWRPSLEAVDPAFAPDVIIIAVKPQLIAEILPPYARFATAVFLSIAAGTTLDSLATILKNPAAPIVRTMPNLPASIGKGMTVAVANAAATPEQRALCDKLLGAVGQTAWLEQEALLDAVTALSGSGPAYVFALCEAMAKAGEALGLSAEMAAQLARQTVVGSGALLAKAPESASDLRRAVTSPKGTTEAALTHLLADDRGLNALLLEAMSAAATRAKELAK